MKKALVILGLTLALTTNYAVAAIAGTVNGMEITVDEANKALKMLSKGQKTWKDLPDDGKKQLIQI